MTDPTTPDDRPRRSSWVVAAAVFVAVLGFGAYAIVSDDLVPNQDPGCPDPIVTSAALDQHGPGKWYSARGDISTGTRFWDAVDSGLVEVFEAQRSVAVPNGHEPEGNMATSTFSPNVVATCDIPEGAVLVLSQWQGLSTTTTIDPAVIASWGAEYCTASLTYLDDLDAAYQHALDGDNPTAYTQASHASTTYLNALADIEPPPDPIDADELDRVRSGAASFEGFAAGEGRPIDWSRPDQVRRDLDARIQYNLQRMIEPSRASRDPACLMFYGRARAWLDQPTG